MTDLEKKVKNLEEIFSEQNKNIKSGFDQIENIINQFNKKLEISNSTDVRLPTDKTKKFFKIKEKCYNYFTTISIPGVPRIFTSKNIF